MFNAEKLLGKIIRETIGGGATNKSKGGGLLDSLTSGKGLMAAIGLGVGAYEILKNQQSKSGAEASRSGATPPPMPPVNAQSTGAPPPPVPGTSQAPPPPPLPPEENTDAAISSQDLALRMIQVMIAAAHADGVLDESEEKLILDRLRGAELDSEENMFLVAELHRPKSIAELTKDISDPVTAETMYALQIVQDNYPDLKFHFTSEFSE